MLLLDRILNYWLFKTVAVTDSLKSETAGIKT